MGHPLYKMTAPKKATNLSINSDLLRQARAMNLNLSGELELRLVEILKQKLAEQWQQDNKEAIDDYNARVERDGVFSDGLRRF